MVRGLQTVYVGPVLVALTLSAVCYTLIGRAGLQGSLLNVHSFPIDFVEPGARRLAEAVAAGQIETALRNARICPGCVNTIGSHGATILLIAVERGNHAMAQALIRAGADPDGAPDYAPLLAAVKNTDPHMVRILIEAHANPDKTLGRETPLEEAALIGLVEAAYLLISAGANINVADEVGGTPMLTAATTDHWIMVSYLLDHGATPWADANGMTVADLATDSRVLPESPEGRALSQTVQKLKDSGYPWPPPTVGEIRARKSAGTWPPTHK